MMLGTRARGVLLVLVLTGVRVLHAQDPRDSVVARAANQFNLADRLPLLLPVLDPLAGPPTGSWPHAVQLYAEALLETGHDSVAAVWLRWAFRLNPGLEPDSLEFQADVIGACNRARTFTVSTVTPGDS